MREQLKIVTLIVVPIILYYIFLGAVFNAHFEKRNKVVLQEKFQTKTELLEEKYSEPDIKCKQVTGEDRQFPNSPSPQAECSTSQFGFFFWQRETPTGWETFYYNQYPSRLTGFLFTTNPKKIRVVFKDVNGNVSEAILDIISDYKECSVANSCYRV